MHIHTEPCAQVGNQPFTICPWWWHVWRPRVVVQHIKLIWQTLIVVNYNQPLLEPIYNGLLKLSSWDRLVSLAVGQWNWSEVSAVSGYNSSAFSLRLCNPSTAHWIWHCACLMVSDDRCNTCDNTDSSARTSFISNRFPRTPSMKWSYTYRSAHSWCEVKVSVYDWAKSFFVFLQQRCVHVRSYFNNGNAVPMRSGSFSTMGTAFPRVPPRNDPCTLNMSMMTMMMMTMMMLMWWWTEWRSSGTKPYRVRQAARRARYDSGGHRQISHWYRLKSTARP